MPRQSTTKALLAAAAVIVLAGPGCSRSGQQIMGEAPPSAASAVVSEATKSKPGTRCTLSGEMTEKCPVAGCWFMLRDKSGVVRIDTKASGFVVTSVPLHSRVTVTGSVAGGAGMETTVAATGIRY